MDQILSWEESITIFTYQIEKMGLEKREFPGLWHRRQDTEDQDQEPELCAEWRKAWKYVQRKIYALKGLGSEKEEKGGE